jgi:hypothetical protein
MRKLAAVILFLPFLGTHVSKSPNLPPPPSPPASFPVTFDRTSSDAARPSVLLFPLEGHEAEFALTSAEDGVLFDVDGDGVQEKVAWTPAGANVAFLAIDLNGDGRINSGRELFVGGTASGGQRSWNVLTDVFLKSGAEKSGKIHDGDNLYDRLLLWVDRNHDGRSERSELTSVRERYTAIGLGYEGVRWADAHGNRIPFRGWMHVRTAGADQGEPTSALEDRQRTQHYFEVQLQAILNQ